MFWPIPQGYLDARIAAAVIALINSVGNLGGFVAPTTFGLLEQTTGSIEGGLYWLGGHLAGGGGGGVFSPAPRLGALCRLRPNRPPILTPCVPVHREPPLENCPRYRHPDCLP